MSIGVAGEICIAGIGLSKGYLNKPELTAERFVADPFRPEEKMYRTGDIGRWSSGGEIEFLGRRDNQVKVRGYRVELGEVQQAMMKVEGVNDAMVIAQKNEYGDNELIAYFTDGKGLDTSFLRAALGRSSPGIYGARLFCATGHISPDAERQSRQATAPCSCSDRGDRRTTLCSRGQYHRGQTGEALAAIAGNGTDRGRG